jgi:hypothetical protein
MTSPEEQDAEVDRLARSMLLLHGGHDDDDGHGHPEPSAGGRTSWSKALTFPDDDPRAVAVREATQRDRDRYLNSGLVSVDCRFCHVSVKVKKLGRGHTSVQWDSEASKRCAHFTEVRQAGGQPARTKTCPKLADSIKHAVAEGCLEENSTAPSPGDG